MGQFSVFDKKIVNQYIERHIKKYDLIIPMDIIRLCLLFYQMNFEWTIDLENEPSKSIYKQSFEISRIGTDIIAKVEAQFEVKKYNSMFQIYVQDISSVYRESLNSFVVHIHICFICLWWTNRVQNILSHCLWCSQLRMEIYSRTFQRTL